MSTKVIDPKKKKTPAVKAKEEAAAKLEQAKKEIVLLNLEMSKLANELKDANARADYIEESLFFVKDILALSSEIDFSKQNETQIVSVLYKTVRVLKKALNDI